VHEFAFFDVTVVIGAAVVFQTADRVAVGNTNGALVVAKDCTVLCLPMVAAARNTAKNRRNLDVTIFVVVLVVGFFSVREEWNLKPVDARSGICC
jgi:hypothetical protein